MSGQGVVTTRGKTQIRIGKTGKMVGKKIGKNGGKMDKRQKSPNKSQEKNENRQNHTQITRSEGNKATRVNMKGNSAKEMSKYRESIAYAKLWI